MEDCRGNKTQTSLASLQTRAGSRALMMVLLPIIYVGIIVLVAWVFMSTLFIRATNLEAVQWRCSVIWRRSLSAACSSSS